MYGASPDDVTSGGASFVAVVQAAVFRKRDHLNQAAGLLTSSTSTWKFHETTFRWLQSLTVTARIQRNSLCPLLCPPPVSLGMWLVIGYRVQGGDAKKRVSTRESAGPVAGQPHFVLAARALVTGVGSARSGAAPPGATRAGGC